MSKFEMLLRVSHDLREWVKTFAHYLVPAAFIIGKHLKQPSYMKKKED